MITYVYRCNSCQFEYEIQQRIIEKPIKKCPTCKKNKCERLLCEPIVLSMGPQTLGTLAERNTRKMSKEELQIKRENDAKSTMQANDHLVDQIMPGKKLEKPKSKPFYHNAGSASQAEIQKMDPKQTEKYIMEGKK